MRRPRVVDQKHTLLSVGKNKLFDQDPATPALDGAESQDRITYAVACTGEPIGCASKPIWSFK